MLQKYFNAPCRHCEHEVTNWDKFDYSCPFFKNGVIPDDIISGKNDHTKPHKNQIGDTVYKERIIEFRT